MIHSKQHQGCRIQDPGTHGKHQTKTKNPWCTSRGCRVQNSGPWDLWLPVVKNSRQFAQRGHSARCAPPMVKIQEAGTQMVSKSQNPKSRKLEYTLQNPTTHTSRRSTNAESWSSIKKTSVHQVVHAAAAPNPNLTLTQTNLQQPLRCTTAALRQAIREDHKWVEKMKWQSNNAGAHIASEFANIIRIIGEAKDFLFFFFCARVGLQMCHLVLFSACLALFDQRRRTGHSSGSARRGPGARDTAT